MKEKIRLALVAKYKNLGFSNEAIDAMLAYLEPNIKAEDQIDASVEAVGGLFAGFQKEVDRRANQFKSDAEKWQESQKGKEEPKGGGANKKDEPATPPTDVPAWAKTLLDQNKLLTDKITAIEQGKSADTRRSQLETTLKDASDAFKTMKLNDFAYMNFESDEKFNEYLEKVKTDSAAFVQAEADKGLGGQGKPIVAGGSTSKTATKEEADALVNNIM